MNVIRADLTVTAWDRPTGIQRHLARIQDDDDVVPLADCRTFATICHSLGGVLVAVIVTYSIPEGPCIWREARPHRQGFSEAEK